ncbi:MAG TPA: hypothetical protein VF614_01195 [Chthoniobacteraceae bacterium]|jgi:hypothetical protein
MAQEYTLRLPGGVARPSAIRQISQAADGSDGYVSEAEAAFFYGSSRYRSRTLQRHLPALIQWLGGIDADGSTSP